MWQGVQWELCPNHWCLCHQVRDRGVKTGGWPLCTCRCHTMYCWQVEIQQSWWRWRPRVPMSWESYQDQRKSGIFIETTWCIYLHRSQPVGPVTTTWETQWQQHSQPQPSHRCRQKSSYLQSRDGAVAFWQFDCIRNGVMQSSLGNLTALEMVWCSCPWAIWLH